MTLPMRRADPTCHLTLTRHPARHPAGPRAGFTLVELVVVLLVLGVAAGWALPLFRDDDAVQLRSAARLLAADLDAARIQSLTHAADPRSLVIDAGQASYHLAPTATPLLPVNNPADGQPYRVTFGHGRARLLPDVTFQQIQPADGQLDFGIYGQLLTSQPALITLAAGDARVTLTVEPDTGQTTVGPLN